VLQVLLDSEEPMYLAQIASRLGETSQLVQYHLQRLVEDGILVTYIEDRKRYYALQPVQYKYPPAALYEIIKPLLEDMAPVLECGQSIDQPSKVLANNLILMLERLAEDIEEMFEDNDYNNAPSSSDSV
jgi:DNA-binding transcriptional ArsR family regulator